MKNNNSHPHEVFVHKAATLIGNVSLSEQVSIWPGVVIRADMNSINIGKAVNIQDNCTLHTDSGNPLTIGDYSLIGHNAMLHGCTIGKGVLIGIGSIVLNKAIIGDGSTVVAGCFIRGGKVIPPHCLVLPDKNGIKIIPNKARPIDTIAGSLEYIELARRYQENIFKPFTKEQEIGFKEQAQKIAKKLFAQP